MIAKPGRLTYPGEAGFTDIYDLPARTRGGSYCRRPFFAEKRLKMTKNRRKQTKNPATLTKIYLI